ncbi:MAG: NAD-dependent epimerase/dehydratase family protein [Eubacteriales bacterium]|nr:NAD-dependent epimerase/dehydratase family protein [Eubacteriales bacterium]
MKRILITGAGSYIGLRVKAYLEQWPEDYQVETISLRDDGWHQRSFQGFDAILHAAGIVHQPKSKDDPSQAELYDRVNHRLTLEVAQKAKEEGVGQFLFLSSESVYGLHAPVGKVITITKDTPICPADNYGISKAKAEEALTALRDETFKVVILRPPMIYGKGCKGNYQTLAKLAKKLPVFPMVENQRSMLYIDNLCEFIRLLVEDSADGLYCPQNAEYVSTSDMVNRIAHANGRGILMVRGFGWALKLLSPLTGMVDKAFGSLCYDRQLSDYPKNYCVKTFDESILETEGKT